MSEEISNEKNPEGLNKPVKKLRTGLLLKISSIYLLLTLINLIIFWVAMGSSQMRLIQGKAVLTGEAKAGQLSSRLRSLTKSKKMQKKLGEIIKKPAKLKKARLAFLINKLKLYKKGNKLIVPNFQLLTTDGDRLFEYPGKKWEPRSSTLQLQESLKAMQRKEIQNQSFLTVPDSDGYNLKIYIPLTTGSEPDLLFFSEIHMPSIQEEMRSLFTLGGSMVVVLLVVQTIFGYFLYRMLVLPIKRLARGASEVATGDYEVQIPGSEKNDEVGQLVTDFNEMVNVINVQTTELVTVNKNLTAKDQLIQKELKLGQKIQKGILPTENNHAFLNTAAYYKALESVSGDYYDIFPLQDGSIGLLVADVSGHGIPAALVMMMSKVQFTNLSEKYENPSDIFTQVNRELKSYITTRDYLTAFYVKVMPDLKIKYGNAGHRPTFIWHRERGEFEEIITSGNMVGILKSPPNPYETKEMQLVDGDRIIMYTDGFIEQTDPNEVELGPARYLDLLKKHIEKPLQDACDAIVKEVYDYAAGSDIKDDFTLLLVEVNHGKTKPEDTES